jgi:hypothetical protein
MAERSGDRIPVEARFSAPVQTGHKAHRTSCAKGTGPHTGVKLSQRGADRPPHASTQVCKCTETVRRLRSVPAPAHHVLTRTFTGNCAQKTNARYAGFFLLPFSVSFPRSASIIECKLFSVQMSALNSR